MDLQSLAALLTGIGGYFSAKAGAAAGQLQGLLTGEELTERRKRMRMAEEAHQQQLEAQRQQMEAQRLQMELLQRQAQREEELFPLQREALATQVEAGKLNLQNQRLWNLYMQGVAPSQITDPVLRQEYERFFNYISAVKSLEAVQTEEDLEAVLKQAGEAHRPTLEILGRSHLFTNRMRQELFQRQLRGLDINLATGEFQLRNAQLNAALNIVLSNIDREGMNWDKRPTEQKIEAVRKWLKEVGLEQAVPPNFPEMFQKVQSSDARQLFLLRAQTDLQLQANLTLLRTQGAINRALQQEAMWSNFVLGAFQQQGVGVPPVGFPAPPTPIIFNPTPNNMGSYLNQSGLKDYLKYPLDVVVPTSEGNQNLSALAAQANNIYNRLAVANPQIDAYAINALVYYDAGLFLSHAAKENMQIDWNIALTTAAQRVLSTLKSHRAYFGNTNYKQVIDNWERAFYENLQRRQPQQPPAAPQPAPQPAPQQRQQQQRPQSQQPPAPRRGQAPLDNMRRTGQRGGI